MYLFRGWPVRLGWFEWATNLSHFETEVAPSLSRSVRQGGGVDFHCDLNLRRNQKKKRRNHPLSASRFATAKVFAHRTVSEGEPPRSYLERVYNIQHWQVFPRGGHFAAVEQPAVLAQDMTAFFLALRNRL